MNLILLTRFGSHLYGTNTENSDTDLKGVYIPNAEDILLGRIRASISQKRKKSEHEKNTAEDIDEEIYSLDKYLKLVSEGQTVSLDMLFSPKQYHLKNTYLWDCLVENREKLLTKKAASFIGYCRTQANKYGIKGSRVAAARDTLAFLRVLDSTTMGAKAKLGEYSDKIESFAKNKEFVEIIDIPLANGQEIRHLSVCDRKLPYTSSVGSAYHIIENIVNEYGTRALQAEKNESIDWKALSHAVRIGEQAIELFQTHFVEFPRKNAADLLKIKKGELPYKQVSEYIEELFVKVEDAAEKSTLPPSVDLKWIDNFIIDVYGEVVKDTLYP